MINNNFNEINLDMNIILSSKLYVAYDVIGIDLKVVITHVMYI